jgi:vitamin B12 transporter
MTIRNARSAWMMTCALVTTSVALNAGEALAQDAELPPIVVEGTTISVPAKKPKKAPAAVETEPVSSNAPGSAEPQPLSSSDAGGPEAAGEVSDAGRLLQNQGSSVTVVTSEDLQRQQIRHAADALKSLPGVSVSRAGGPQSLTYVRIRGAESNHTLVVVDGVEVNTADGAFDFSYLTADDIEQIEVLRGPQSALYSSGALGGVINIKTKSGKGPLTIRTRGEIGTQNSQNGAIQIGGGNDQAHGVFTLAGYRTDGYNLSLQGDEDDGARFSNLSFSGGVEVLPGLTIDATLRRSETDGERDDFDFINIRPDGFEGLADTASEFNQVLTIGRLAATLETFDGKWVHQVSAYKTESDLYDIGRGLSPGTGRFITERSEIAYRSTLTIDTPSQPMVTHYLTGLVEHRKETFEQDSRFAFGNTLVDVEEDRTSFAGELRGEYFKSLFLSATARYDDNRSFDDYATWQTSASWRIPDSIFRVHASAGSGVKYPSLLELYGEFGPNNFVGNPNLQPEESLGWDAGLETTLFGGRAIVDVTYFQQSLKNEIFSVFLPFGYTADNREGESDRKGIEVSGRFNLARGLDLGLAYTYLDATEPSGQEEIRRPPHSGRVDVGYTTPDERGKINLAVAYTGDTFDENFNYNSFSTERLLLEDYWLVTLAGSYQLAPGVELYGRVENLLDEKYTEIIGIDSAPVAAFVGMKFTYVEEATRAWAEGR